MARVPKVTQALCFALFALIWGLVFKKKKKKIEKLISKIIFVPGLVIPNDSPALTHLLSYNRGAIAPPEE